LLWFGTFAGGVSSYSPDKHKFHLYGRDPRNPATLADAAVFSILVDQRGTLWVGTQLGGLHRYSEDRRSVVERYFNDPDSPRDLGTNYVGTLYEDRAGSLWAGTGGGGLVLIDPDAGRVVRRYTNDPEDDTSIASNGVNAMLEDSNGTFWLSTGNGIDIFDRENGTFEHIQHDPEHPDNSLPQALVRTIHEDRQGGIWLATAAGLCTLDRESHEVACRSHDPTDPESLSHNNVMALHEDDDGILWLATYGGGLNRFDPGSGEFSSITTRDGLPNDSLYSVVPDGDGHLWLSSNRGLVRFDPRTREITAYDAEDGLQSNEFNDRSFHASADGELFFGGIHGFNSFRPEEIQPSGFVPPVVLTSFRKLAPNADTVRIFDGIERFVVRHRDVGFAFEFAALDYSSPGRTRYAYRLDGFDEDWIESGNRRFASYTNLDGGTYTFRVRGTNADGIWNEEGASVEIVVVPPPWKTWWAYTLYVLMVSGGVLGYVQYKTIAQAREVERHRQEAERLKQIDRMKDEFLANTSHELRTPLNGIIGITESVLDGATGEVSETMRDNLAMVSSSGRRLAHLVDDILDFSKLRNHEIVLRERPVALRELVEVTVTLSRGLIGSRRLELHNDVAADLPHASADEDRLQQILHNLIGNAIKFTHEGEVHVSARTEGDRILVAVSDSGVGIPADKLEKIFESFEQADASSAREFGGTGLGLTVSRQLVELHGGTIEVESTVGEGSTFTFSLPLWTGEIDAAEIAAAKAAPLATVRDHTERVAPFPAPAVGAAAPALALAALPESEPDAEPDSDADAEPRRSPQVLCVDDEPVNLQVLENILRLEGYTVRRANDGLECLEILHSGFLPDLILLDVMMPRMTGFEVARRIRKDFPAPKLPILMVTAKNQVTDLVEGLSSGANDYLSKPFSKPELLARVQTHLNLSRAASMEAENKRKSEEMKQARAIQLSLLPKAPPELPRFEIAAHLETATEVGGDYYDFFPQDDGSLYIVTGDATGHGISAGMMVSMTKSALKALEVTSPQQLLQQLNDVMRAVDLTRMQMALNVVYLTGETVRISSAAMPPAIHFHADDGRAEEILLPGLPLGAMSDAVYGLAELGLRSGDALVMVSDGLPELVDLREGVDGYATVRETVEQHGAESAQELVDALVGLISEEDHPLGDDVTIVVVRQR
jgi:signal transduction histidine kinase/serine phosphatase RsbU (regulator of sigma subunit)/ligand-binding sensor domain-containing protein